MRRDRDKVFCRRCRAEPDVVITVRNTVFSKMERQFANVSRNATAFALPFFGANKRFLFNNAFNRSNQGSARMEAQAPVAQVKKPARMPAIIRPMVPSEKLKTFVDDRAMPRSEVLKTLVAYVRERELQDPMNKTMVLCDERLGDLLGVEKCTILQISKHITKHLKKPEDVGGRYVQEAAVIEKEYLDNYVQKEKGPKSKRKSGSDKERSERDRAAGARLFKPVTLSRELAALCGGRSEMPRQEIIKAVWDYIKSNNLKGPPGQPVRCDAAMQKVFGAPTVTVQGVMKGISAHVTKKN